MIKFWIVNELNGGIVLTWGCFAPLPTSVEALLLSDSHDWLIISYISNLEKDTIT